MSSIAQETQTEEEEVEKNDRRQEQREQQAEGEEPDILHYLYLFTIITAHDEPLEDILSFDSLFLFFFLVRCLQGVKKRLKKKPRRNLLYAKLRKVYPSNTFPLQFSVQVYPKTTFEYLLLHYRQRQYKLNKAPR